MALDAPTFRIEFPEFIDPPYTDALVDLYLDRATKHIGKCLDPVYNEAQGYLTAFYLSEWTKNNAATAGGIPPGMDVGAVTSKTVSKGSISFDVNSTTVHPGSPFNANAYGRYYLWLIDTYCAGPVQFL